MHLESRIRRLETRMIPEPIAVGVDFGPADDPPPPPSDPAALTAWREAVAMDATIPDVGGDDEELE